MDRCPHPNTPPQPCHRRARQRGVAAIEFALVLPMVLMGLFGTLELMRYMFLYNTMFEVTRRAAHGASVTHFRDTAALARLRAHAVLRDDPGPLPLGAPVSDAYVRIDYLALVRNADHTVELREIPTGSLPSCPGRNRLNCLTNPNAQNCIRFVRARVCQPGAGECNPAVFQGIIPFINFRVGLPVAELIVPAESLGHIPGGSPCG